MKLRVGRKQKRVVLDENGLVVVEFPAGSEHLAAEYVKFKNSKVNPENQLHELRESLDKILNKYIDLFVKKQGRDFEFAVGNDLMGVLYFGDVFYFHISDVIYDIDNNVENGLIFQWLDDTMEHQDHSINFESYHKGLRYKTKKP